MGEISGKESIEPTGDRTPKDRQQAVPKLFRTTESDVTGEKAVAMSSAAAALCPALDLFRRPNQQPSRGKAVRYLTVIPASWLEPIWAAGTEAAAKPSADSLDDGIP